MGRRSVRENAQWITGAVDLGDDRQQRMIQPENVAAGNQQLPIVGPRAGRLAKGVVEPAVVDLAALVAVLQIAGEDDLPHLARPCRPATVGHLPAGNPMVEIDQDVAQVEINEFRYHLAAAAGTGDVPGAGRRAGQIVPQE